MTDPSEVLALEPGDLDGHTIEELTDYLEADRQPADPTIDNSPACQMALSALQRLRVIASTYLDDGGEPEVTDENWIGGVLAMLPLELRRGREFPIPTSDPVMSVHITEGALRDLIRATGDTVPGLLIGSVRIAIPTPTAPEGDLDIDVALMHGTALPAATRALRRAVHDAVHAHAPFRLGRIDIHVVDLLTRRSAEAGDARP